MSRLMFLMFAAVLAAGCTESPSPSLTSSEDSTAAPFDARLLEIARDYESYGRLDAEPRWAPLPCAAPDSAVTPLDSSGTRPRFSTSKDSETHGRKLYYLFVKNVPDDSPILGNYVRPGTANPIGQVVVKESWEPEEI